MSFETNALIALKDSNFLERQRKAGKCVGKALSTINSMIASHTPNLSLLDLEQKAAEIINENHCLPTFKGYKGFPSVICLSVNKELVHGIPSKYILKDGDVVKFDLGATFEGAIADGAATAIYGSSSHAHMVSTCKEALDNAIKSIQVGKRIGCIGYVISKTAAKHRYGVITAYGGHGIEENVPHASPFVPNKSQPTEGIRIQPGMVLAVEPMFSVRPAELKIANDGWTVVANEVCAHFEHTIFVHPDSVEVITDWN